MTERVRIIISLIENGTILFTAASGVFYAIYRFFNWMEKRSIETSVGAEKVLELMKKDMAIEESMKDLEEKFEDRDDERGAEIRGLAKEIRDFTFQAIQLIGLNNHK